MEIISPQSRSLGDGFVVARVLPNKEHRHLGPFVFFDHFGPLTYAPGKGMQVRPHPHIGLATVTYLFEGEIHHRDTIGSDQTISPGAINWMIAGSGIAHSERTALPDNGGRLHGIQLWVALPKADEECAPSFRHYDNLPALQRDGVAIRVLAGTAYGVTSPVQTASPLFYVEAELSAGARLALPAGYEERGAYVVQGAVQVDEQPLAPQSLALFSEDAELFSPTGAHVLLLGGAPFPEQRYIWWNFVSSSKERITRAAEDWRDGRFGKIPGDETEFIPLPDLPHLA